MGNGKADWSDRKKWWMELLAKGLEGLCIGIAVFVLQSKWQKADARSLAARQNEDQRQEYLAKGVIEQTRNTRARFLEAGWEYIEGEFDAFIDVYEHGSGSEKKSEAQGKYEGALNTKFTLVSYEAREACTFDRAANESIQAALGKLEEARKASYGVYDNFEDLPATERAEHKKTQCPGAACERQRFQGAHLATQQAFLSVDERIAACIRQAEQQYFAAAKKCD
jgi:hypothetical protein